ncbi:hypothetical protein AC1031_014126 [Aphanomyces cochlioides]|nr:hypothetical protein AC1031_014126 [Aphanomyces cochlioides]
MFWATAAAVALASFVLAAAVPTRAPVYEYTRTALGGTSGVYNESHAIYLGRLVSTAYCPKKDVESWTCPPCANVSKLQDLIVINDKSESFQGILGFTGTHVVVAFRGSMDVKNWVDNLSFLKTRPWPHIFPKAAIHRGFYAVYKSIQDKLFVALSSLFALHPSAPLIITGHSLGSAVAAIAVVDLHTRHNITTESMLTFGEPRVGNPAFVSRLTHIVSDIHRITHWRDIVPHVPLEWQGYIHEAQEIWYTEDSTSFTLCDPANGEDPWCSKQVPTISSFADHLVYLNITMSHLIC